MTNEPIRFDAKSFIIRGKREFLIGGEFHYFRTPNELWEDRLIKMKRSGANLITTYIPWNWHEPFEGEERWSGDCDVARFIELCQKHELFIVVKPGPYCCAEWDFGGHPDWLLSKDIPLRVLNDRYLSYVAKWYRRVAEVIKPYMVTNGGNVICIQVENEYDHLMEYGKEKISKEDAITYFTRLGGMMEEFGIDIPKFANEAGFLRGKGNIIDTRTYYPNIPLFQFWMYMHNYFDGKIMAAKSGQPNCPTMILELQIGWFAQYGRPLYTAPVHLTESVTKSVVALGASMLNYYMYVGGTTFPFWGCRGNIWEILPKGTGTATTFDFGGSPVREWGELMPGRVDWIKGFSQFARDYKPLVLESDNVDELKIVGGGEGVEFVRPGSVEPDTAMQSETENFKVITRKLDDQYLVCIRNLGAEDKTVDVGWTKDGSAVFRGLEVPSRATHLLPVNVRVPGTDIRILRSTSELLFARKAGSHVLFGIYGKPGRTGETVLNIPASDVKVLAGNVQVTGDQSVTLSYVHKGVLVVQAGAHKLFILDQDISGKVEELENGIVIADTYFIKGVESEGNTVTFKTLMRNASKNAFAFFDGRAVASVEADGRNVEVENDPAAGRSSFSVRNGKQKPVTLEWKDAWKITPDNAEAGPSYDDSAWQVLGEPISLEQAGLLQHGYIWYRAEFELPADVEDASLVYPGNDCDRQHVYVNGQHVWQGIDGDHEIGVRHALRPGRNVIAVLYENFFHSKSHPHEGAIRKYSGIMKPVKVTARTKAGRAVESEIRSFKVREQLAGNLGGYDKPDFNDSAWQTVKPAHKYVMDNALGTIVWMRRNFTYRCKKNWDVAVRLTIPNGSERCLMYLNGRPLGQFENAGPQTEFYVPSAYLKKDNALAIVLEGPRGWIIDPKLDTFYEAKEVDVKITLG